MKKKLGLTMVEVIVTLFVMTIMFGMVVAIIMLIKNNFNDAERRSSMQQNASVALAKLTRELMETSPETITVYNPLSGADPKGIIFASAREPSTNNKFDLDTTTAECVWHKYICYYLDTDPENPAEKALFRKEKEITETTDEAPSSDSTLNFKNDSSLHTTIVAHRVEDLDFEDLGAGTFAPEDISAVLPLKITLTLAEKTYDDGNKNAISVTFSVNMHN